MKIYVDGGIHVRLRITGAEHLSENDHVAIYYAANSNPDMIFRAREVLKSTQCKVTCHPIDAGKEDVHYAVMVDAVKALEENGQETIVLVGEDDPYGSVRKALLRQFPDALLRTTTSIDGAIRELFLLSADTRERLYTALTRVFGKYEGKRVYKQLYTLFQPENEPPAVSVPLAS